jgi:hypothetical protein
MSLQILSTSDFEYSLYLRLLSDLGITLIKGFDLTLLNDPDLLSIISRFASKIDTSYNEIYGGESISYTNNTWLSHFTDDFWTLFFLVKMNIDDHPKFVHLSWILSRLCNLMPTGPTSYSESKATMTIRYGNEDWTECTIRDRRHQFVPYHALGDEQKKDDIPTKAFTEIIQEFGKEHVTNTLKPFSCNFNLNAFPL